MSYNKNTNKYEKCLWQDTIGFQAGPGSEGFYQSDTEPTQRISIYVWNIAQGRNLIVSLYHKGTCFISHYPYRSLLQ